MTYRRVIPRDLFNEGSLLKCLGQLWLAVEGYKVTILHTGNDFYITQSEADGSIRVGNICIIIGGTTFDHHRPLNSREPWPLYITRRAGNDGEEIAVFRDDGKLSDEFKDLLTPLDAT